MSLTCVVFAALQGPVYALAAGNNMLFSGGHDQSIRVWQFNQPAGLFEAAVRLFQNLPR